jgi:hypothetical protein
MIIGSAVLIAVGTSAFKMSQSEVQQVEEYTGQKVEDLSEEKLDSAMGDLGIEGQEPTDQEVAMLEAEDGSAPVAPASAPASQADVITQLERLGTLKAHGILTEEEFQAQKAKLLGI